MTSGTNPDACDIVYRALNASGIDKVLALPSECVGAVSRDLITIVKDQQGQIQSLSAKIDSLQFTLEANSKSQSELITQLEQSYSSRFEDMKVMHMSHQDHIDGMFDSHLGVMSSWITGFGVIIAIAGALTFYFVSRYKRREIQEVVDCAQDKVMDQINNGETLKNLMVNLFSTTEVKEEVEKLNSEMWGNVEPLIKSVIDDYNSSTNSEIDKTAKNLEAIITKSEGG